MRQLSKAQKAAIAMLARKAWALCPQRAALLEANRARGMSATAIFEAWRHVEQGKACGKQSLRQCTSEQDYLKLRAHFEALIGRYGRALRTLLRHAEEPRLVARHKLEEACRERGLSLAYPASICRRQYRCGLDDATEQQLWRLVFTVRNRRRKAAHPATEPTPANQPF